MSVTEDVRTPFEYGLGTTPDDYRCCACGVFACKLWRDSTSKLQPSILCCYCAGLEAEVSVDDINHEGMRASTTRNGLLTNQIGWYIPAVPVPDGSGYYDDTSSLHVGCSPVPKLALDWWKSLRTHPYMKPRV
ncbi:MAG: hypothetical protein ABA06_01415 [Parcubacteria bacterium C7867-001]|nr:MAG: hypothetical protein ABA06_01415 [Parcubacteria bacterium C7867-001]